MAGEDLTVAEAAALLGMTRQGVRELALGGKLPHRYEAVPARRRERMVVPREEVERLARSRPRPGGARFVVDRAERGAMAAAGYLTVTEAAKIVGLSASYLSKLIRAGRVPGKVGTIAYMRRADADALRDERNGG